MWSQGTEIKGGGYREADVNSVQGRTFSDSKLFFQNTGCLERVSSPLLMMPQHDASTKS